MTAIGGQSRPDAAKGQSRERQPLEGRFSGAVTFVVSILMGLLVGGVVMAAVGYDAVGAYRALVEGALGSSYGLGETLLSTTPLLLSGLAVAVSFHCSLFNIGVEGQLMMGGMAAALAGFGLHGLPAFLHVPIVMVAGILGGAVWGAIPGYLKARRGVHEVITTIMMNYIAFSFTQYLVKPHGPFAASDSLPASPLIELSARLPRILSGTRLTPGILVALAAAAFVWVLLWRTPLGYRIRMVGMNPGAAEYAGIDVPYHMTMSMILSGALAGLAGAVEIMGVHYRFFSAFSPGYGFDAIAIALVGQLNPFGVSVAALIFGMLHAGSVLMQEQAQVSRDLIFVISGVITFFMAANVLIGRVARWPGAWRRGPEHAPRN